MYNKILVPLDGSATAEKVLPYARYLAGKFNVPAELLGVIDVGEMAAHLSADRAVHLERIVSDATASAEEYLRGVAATFAANNIRYTVERGRPEDTIIEKAAGDRGMLLAMATHGRSGLNRFMLGSVAEKVLRGTANPLLLVRATEEAKSAGEATLKSIIVPLDGSELAEGALPAVAELAKKLGAGVELFRAYHIPYNVYAGGEGYAVIDYDELIAGVRQEATEYLDKKVAELKNLGVTKVDRLAKEGIAGDEIIGLGRERPHALIAMSSHGRSGVRRWMLGSVAENVVRHSVAPVLVMRAG